MNKESDKKGLILTLLYPFAGIIYTLRHLKANGTSVCFCLICFYWGLAFVYYTGMGVFGEGSDSERYALSVIQAHSMNDKGLIDYIKTFDKSDVYAPTIIYLVSRFSDNPQVFYGIVALIIGIFFSKSAWIIINRTNDSKLVYLFIIAMLLSSPIWNINGVRWWTALYIFLYGLFIYFFEHKKGGLIWCALSLAIHFTFLFAIYMLLAYLILPKKRTTPYLVLFVLMSLLSSFDFEVIANYLYQILPDYLDKDMVVGYSTFEYKGKEFHNWFADSGRIVIKYCNLYIVLVAYFLSKNEIEKNDTLRKFFILMLIIASGCLFINLAPWGIRFLDLSNFLTMAFFAYFLSLYPPTSQNMKWYIISIPFLAFFLLYQLNFGLYSIGIWNLLFGNFLTVFLYNDLTPLHFYLEYLF